VGTARKTPPPTRRSGTPKFRVVVTDVDGTLTDSTRRLDPEAVRAVRRVEDRGVPVILATGNVLPIALALHRSLGLSGPIVAENGGLVWWKDPAGRDRVERLADRRVALAGVPAPRTAGVPVHRLFTDRWRESEVALEANVSVAKIRPHLRGLGITAEATGYAIHLMERGGGEAPALAAGPGPPRVAPSRSAVAVGGRRQRRSEMLRAAGVWVSFANGSPRARAAAALGGAVGSYRRRVRRSALSDGGFLALSRHSGGTQCVVGSCARCGRPASLGCTFCGRTFCRGCLDADERMCAECAQAPEAARRGPPVVPLSRRRAGNRQTA
jgi:phosphoglycolate phosphatase